MMLIIICAGQTPFRTLFDDLKDIGPKYRELNIHLIGGAYEAGELDAKRVINQASHLAAVI